MKTKKELVQYIYGDEKAPEILEKISQLQNKWSQELGAHPNSSSLPLSEDDTIMISYGDSILDDDKPPLDVLKEFGVNYLKDMVSGIHILPFSPYTSDDGFSVVDYREINPDLGTWNHVESLGEHFDMMFDLVLNHCSASSEWFKAYLKDDPKYRDYFIPVDPDTNLDSVFRPRALPLLTPFDTARGKEHIWTTFSPDQVDVNFASPDVMLDFLDIFLMYFARGAKIVRLDAIGFLWKEIGTSCMHHPKTHAMVQLYRAILKETAPHTLLLTETNVPHKDNISYFGEGNNEAHMVYQFSLPPLTLDAFVRQDCQHLTDWAASLPPVNGENTYFNFMSSHDGVGVLPARGYLRDDEVDNLVAVMKSRGGRVNYKSTPEGEIPYELNINYRDAVTDHSYPNKKRAEQFIASQAIMLCMAGVPGIYVHSLLGSGNWEQGVVDSGINRRVNREKLNVKVLIDELDEEGSLRNYIYHGFKGLLKIRRNEPAFSPLADQRILNIDPSVFALVRSTGDRSVLCIQSASAQTNSLHISLSNIGCGTCDDFDLLTGNGFYEVDGDELILTIPAFDVFWLKY